jgi:hypothetical protein
MEEGLRVGSVLQGEAERSLLPLLLLRWGFEVIVGDKHTSKSESPIERCIDGPLQKKDALMGWDRLIMNLA